MRILMCSHYPLDRRLGAPKVLIELSEALRAAGAAVTLVQPSDYGAPVGQEAGLRVELTRRLAEFLQKNASGYDAVDFDHEDLPFERDQFDPRVLLVARSVLLVHHLDSIPIPRPRTARALAGRLVHGRQRQAVQRLRIQNATRTIAAADLVNVSNEHDRAELLRHGVKPGKIVVLPFGLSARRFEQLAQAYPIEPPTQPVVAFVGTFDYRKGALDFPRIGSRLIGEVPLAKLKLLGTAGMFATAEQVLAFFPHEVCGRVEVMPRFDPDELPQLLSGCSVGVFPSYVEGFGFGVLEMLAAGLPVFAYDAPGPPMMLSPAYLVAPGDADGLANRAISLLRDPSALAEARSRARTIAAQFNWDRIAAQTLDAYGRHLRRIRGSR